ncbi:putative ATP-grasp-modified RiPP [Streptomyces sp. NPDC048416]|uniref:putative ATP-grasp-modified RiPP n=1 Tax=Streptomyces sp. NPDC048416 TaxID=3365546 RepID=UPI00371F439F
MNPIAHPHAAFPLAPEGGRIPQSTEQPSGSASRPWILRYATLPDSTQVTPLPEALYDEEQQISVGVDTDVLPYMQTNNATVPDGSPSNPPPIDEGAKD